MEMEVERGWNGVWWCGVCGEVEHREVINGDSGDVKRKVVQGPGKELDVEVQMVGGRQ